MKADAWFPFYVGDYLRDTMHLSRDEHGGYLLLLSACWMGGGRVKNDEKTLASITLSSPTIWRNKLAKSLLPFFRIEGDFLVHGRVLAEKEKAKTLSEKRREAGSKGGRKPKANAKPGLTPAHVQEPAPSPPPTEDSRDIPSESPLSSAEAEDDPWTSMYGDDEDEPAVEAEVVPFPVPTGKVDTRGLLTPPAPDILRQAFDAYNILARELGLPVAQSFTADRRNKLKLRMAGDPQRWQAALDEVQASRFLHGFNDRGWKADLNFMLQASSFDRLVEGGYRNIRTTEATDARNQQPTSRDRKHDAYARELIDVERAMDTAFEQRARTTGNR